MANMRAFGSADEYVLNVTASDGVHHTTVPMTISMLPENRVRVMVVQRGHSANARVCLEG